MSARAGGFLPFVVLAAGLHLAAFGLARPAGESAAGAGGTAAVTLLGGDAALVEAWLRPPLTGEAAAPAPPPAPARPLRQAATAPALPALPALPPAAEERPAPSQPATRPAPAAPEAAPVPRPRPAGLEAPTSASEPVRPPDWQPVAGKPTAAASRAAGRGGTETAGVAGRGPAPSGEAKAASRAQAVWGAALQRALQRGIVVAPGLRVRRETRVLIALEITPEGQLLRAGIARSSGRPDIDRAVLAAVRRTGPLPRAPEGLTAPAYPFEVPIVLEPA